MAWYDGFIYRHDYRMCISLYLELEKYNKSIDNLNDLKTLNGALVYMNELRIELQWNSNNEAYKKLLELVHRKFEA